jgi:hypothetical protein
MKYLLFFKFYATNIDEIFHIPNSPKTHFIFIIKKLYLNLQHQSILCTSYHLNSKPEQVFGSRIRSLTRVER